MAPCSNHLPISLFSDHGAWGGGAVVLDSNAELDKDLWVTLEDLHTQNTNLLAEVAELKAHIKGGAGAEGSKLGRRASGAYR